MTAQNPPLDLNADLGEGCGEGASGGDEAMLEVVTTANIACGGHAGDARTMRAACRAAAAHGTAITAHVSYADVAGFGRRFVDLSPEELTDLMVVQAGALQAMARAEGAQVRGVKPHGALYNALAHHEAQAAAVVRALMELGGLPLVAAPGAVVVRAAREAGLEVVLEGFADRAYLPDATLTPRSTPGAVVVRAAEEAGLEVVLEGFADRAYLPDATLTPRSTPGAVLTDPGQVLAQALSIATEGGVRTADGTWVQLPVRSLCLHGDTPGALALARTVRAGLEEAGVQLAAAL